MPNDFPYFPFYVNDFTSDGDVEAMTTLEVGAYILLLCKAWKEKPRGSIPDNDETLARWTRLTPIQWAECRTRVLACFIAGNDGRWHQKRMELEARKLVALASTRSRAGKKGAEVRWSEESEDGKRIANASDCHDFAIGKTMASDSDSDSGSGSESEKGIGGGRGKGETEFPAPLGTADFASSWSEWLQYRKKIRKPLSEFAVKKQLKFLAGLGLSGALASIEQSIRNDWQGLFEPRTQRENHAPRQADDERRRQKYTPPPGDPGG